MAGGYFTLGMQDVLGSYLSEDARIPVDTGLAQGGAPQSGGMIPGVLIADPNFQALTAQADGTKANATPLTYGINTVTTVAGAADSVLLPTGFPGAVVVVINTIATAIQVFGKSSDTIQAVVTGTGNVQAASVSTVYYCYAMNGTVGLWWKLISA